MYSLSIEMLCYQTKYNCIVIFNPDEEERNLQGCVDASAKIDICVILKMPKVKCLQPLSCFACEPNSLYLYDLHQNILNQTKLTCKAKRAAAKSLLQILVTVPFQFDYINFFLPWI